MARNLVGVLHDVLDVRRAQRADVAAFLATLQPEDLEVGGWRATEPGWPLDPSARSVRECLHVVLDEEWAHRGLCERDLDRLGGVSPASGTSAPRQTGPYLST